MKTTYTEAYPGNRRTPTPNYQLYEQLKEDLNAQVLSPAEYVVAVRKISKLTGV